MFGSLCHWGDNTSVEQSVSPKARERILDKNTSIEQSVSLKLHKSLNVKSKKMQGRYLVAAN
jgi:hypothetical protein